jgi:hypothetical protein
VEAAKPQLPDSAPPVEPAAVTPKKEGAATTLAKGAKDIGGIASDVGGVFGAMGDRIAKNVQKVSEGDKVVPPKPTKARLTPKSPPTLVKPATPGPTPNLPPIKGESDLDVIRKKAKRNLEDAAKARELPLDPMTVHKRNRRMQKINGDV